VTRGSARLRALTAGAASLAAAAVAHAVPAQSALDPAGPQASHIHSLWHLMLGLCTLVFVLVVAAAWFAVLRRRHGDTDVPDLADEPARARRLTRNVGVATAVSIVGLLGLVVASVATDRALAGLPHEDALHIEITGHQWWWEVRYDDADPSKVFDTANEIHIPVGRTVALTLKADDVIHSFWVPNLHGKKDLIPGRTNTTMLRADAPGVYRGQCAEFCGYQHAWMGLLVVADTPADYARWEAAQRATPPEPSDATIAEGRRVFEGTTCAMCHAVQGTRANARRAPDLTHLASRRTLAAVALDNTPANRAAWVQDPQRFKPGSNMPPVQLPPEELGPLLAYLGSLQ
jgi:cytochrome c oxidase subunit 2